MHTLFLTQKRIQGRLMLMAKDWRTELLLMHCAAGLNAVTLEHWDTNVLPLVNAHGWEYEITKEDS
jgi:hypothetical protein